MPKLKNNALGQVVTDVDPKYLQKGDITDSLDTYSGEGSDNDGARVPMPGTFVQTSITYSGSPTIIGTIENKQRNNSLVFVSQTGNDHRIYIFGSNGARILSPKGAFLNLANRIHSAPIVDGRFVYWTDGLSTATGITGNPPRKMDIDRADDTNKSLEYEVIFGGGFVDNTRYRVDFYDLDGTPVSNSEYVVVGVAGDKKAGLAMIKTWLDGLGTLTVVNNGCSLEITVIAVETRIRITSSYSGTPSENAWDVLTIPRNHYIIDNIFPVPSPDRIITDDDRNFMLSRVPYQPQFAPTYVHEVDATYTSNHIDRITPQFTFRYIFWDGSKSAWSQYSGVRFPEDGDNSIRVSFTDDWLTCSATLGLITHIELAVRYSDSDTFKSIDVIRVCELTLEPDLSGLPIPFEYVWYNDAIYSEVPSDDDGDGQVLKLFDHSARVSGCLEQVSDETGVTRLVESAILEGYDVQVVDADISEQLSNVFVDGVYKKNSRYVLSIIYADRQGRRSTANKIGLFETAGWDVSGYSDSPYPRITINSLPPSWATHYYIARTKNLYYNRWKTLFSIPDSGLGGSGSAVNTGAHVEFGILDSNESGFTAGAFGDPDNTHFRIRVIAPFFDEDLTNDIVYRFDNNDAAWFFQPSVGDRFRVILQVDDVTSVILAELDEDYELDAYEFEVKDDYYPTTDPNYKAYYLWLYAKLPAAQDYTLFPDDGWVVELYTPRQNEEEVYYEVFGGEITGGYHEGNFQNQSAVQPAIINLIETGDAYRRGGTIPDYHRMPNMTQIDVEAENAFNFIPSKTEPIGKPNIEDPTYGERFYRNRHRVSDSFVPDSQINGLGSFRAVNYIHTNQSFGIVKKTAMVGNVLLAVHEFKAQPIYVSKDRLLSLEGSSVGRTSRLLNIADELLQDWGTQHPESFLSEDGRAYCVDYYRGVWWMYNSQGLEDIRAGRKDFFLDLMRTNVFGTIISGIDRKRKIVFTTFSSGGEGFTFGYSINKNGQEGRFSFLPTSYVSIGKDMYMSKNGQIWKHGVLSYANYFGVQYTPYFIVALHKDNAVSPDQIKVWKNLRVLCPQQKLVLPNSNSITIPATAGYPSGMASRLVSSRWQRYEGEWFADFLRDILTPNTANAIFNGRALRGHVILLKFVPETNSSYFEFFFAEAEYYLS